MTAASGQVRRPPRGTHGTEETGVVSDVQRYCLGDGPGIRTTVFLKGCPLRCVWCQNPESLRPAPQLGLRSRDCAGCRACLDACPRGALHPGPVTADVPADVPADDPGDDPGDVSGTGTPTGPPIGIDRDRCDDCGACAAACPTGALFVIGRRYTVTELLEEVARDLPFYRTSGGGVTLSGGEPTRQFGFALAFLTACKDAGIGTAVETSGLLPRHRLAALLPVVDSIQFDLKLADPAEHARLTGTSNHQILGNARWLARSGAPVTFRIPLVPGATDTETNLRAIAVLLLDAGVREVELCPYHTGWEPKLGWIHPVRPRPGFAPATPADVERATGVLLAAGLHRVRTSR